METMTDGNGGNERLNDVLGRGVDSHRWAHQSLDGKAKAILTASTLTLGIVMGGLGAGAGMAGGATLSAWGLLAGIHPCVVPLVAALIVASLALIFLSVYLAVRALRVFTMDGFGNADAFVKRDGQSIDHGAIREWVEADSRHVHERTQEGLIEEMLSLRRQNKIMGRRVRHSQTCLLCGLLLSVAWGGILVGAGIVAQAGAAP